jgi:hypothetical protein
LPAGFPGPLQRLRAGPMWDRRKTDDWLRAREDA